MVQKGKTKILAKIELNHAHAKAIESISKETGIEEKILITQAINEFIKQQEYNTWLECKVKKGFDDLEARRVKTSEEVIESAMSAIRKISQK